MLNLEGATFGVDANGINTYVNKLNTECIEATISKMNSGMDELRTAGDNAWVGKSAETFKNNMEADKETITNALRESYETLKSELFDIASKIGEVDQELVKPR